MKPIIKLTNKILERLILNQTLSDKDIEEILSLEKESLVDDIKELINRCKNNNELLEADASYNLLLFSLFILKEIDESPQHLKTILDILKLDENLIDVWFGDTFVEYYWILVYHFGKHEIQKLVSFLKQEEIYTFCKEQVALALYQIYLKNEEKREDISKYWTELLEFFNSLPEEDERVDYTFLSFFTSYISNPSDYQKSLIKDLYDKEYIDLTINGNFEDLFDFIEEERAIYTIYDVNNDAILYEDSFNSEFSDKFTQSFIDDVKKIVEDDKIKIGRNDLCFCGSGLKYKKCCME